MDKTNLNLHDDIINDGPLSILKDAVKKKNHILIYCRNNRKLYGQLRAFDRHMNMVLENIIELWTETSRTKKGNPPVIKNQERHINKLFLRGDSVILVVKKPNPESIKNSNN